MEGLRAGGGCGWAPWHWAQLARLPTPEGEGPGSPALLAHQPAGPGNAHTEKEGRAFSRGEKPSLGISLLEDLGFGPLPGSRSLVSFLVLQQSYRENRERASSDGT